MNAAKTILKEVVCEVNLIGGVRVGMAVFRDETDPNGGFVMEPIDLIDGTQVGDLVNAINALEGETWTPLGETLFQLYTYFMSRTTDEPAEGRERRDVSRLRVPHESAGTTAATTPRPRRRFRTTRSSTTARRTSSSCITDGEPTKDDFDDSNTADDTGRASPASAT